MDQDPYAERGAVEGEGLHLPPWEERERYGLLNALYLTARDALLSPGPFFRRMPTRLGLVQPLLFAVVVTFAAGFFEFLWGLMGGSLERFLDRGELGEFLAAPVLLGILWVLSPVTAVVEVLARAAMFHVALMLVGGNRLGFEATFRVCAYASAAGILSLLPFCGGAVGVVWELAITVIGLARIHGVDEWRSLLAVLLPAVLFLLSCFGLAALVVTAGILS